MNLLTSNLQCIECGCTDLIKDFKRCEIYCNDCGLVLMDTTIDVPTLEPGADEDQEQTKEDYYKLRRFMYDFKPFVDAPILQKKR